jgi:hypothetical protein
MTKNIRSIRAGLAALALSAAAGPALAQSTVALTASPQTALLPDGQSVPMWGYVCGATTGATCTATNGGPQSATAWQPPLIRVPAGSLTITLTNALNFGAGDQAVPTSIVIDGQIGGGLGDTPARMPSPVHAPQGTTWPGTLGGIDPATTSVAVTTGGAGYTSPPSVTIVGGSGSGAAAIAKVSGGAVTSIVITSPGSGYKATDVLTVAVGAPPCTASSTCVQATATIDPTLLAATDGSATFVPPAQADRVRSFGTEAAAGGSPATLTWNNLRPGTYLIHSGTQPSIQHPMGLYGVLVVTDPNTPGTAWGQAYDADVPLLLSEIDPAQNAAVDTAVRTAGFNAIATWAGPGKCKDGAAACYPPAVNYSPRYYLVNGVSFDRTVAPASSTQTAAVAPGGASGNVLLRIVNAGQRMHAPAVVGLNMTPLAEDGNPVSKATGVQASIPMSPGKTFDALIKPTQTTAQTYDAATLAVFDRQLSLSTNNQRDGGMQAYILVAGGAATGAGSASSAVALTAANPTFYCVAGTTLAVTEASKGVLAGSTGASGVSAPTGLTGGLSVTNFVLHSDGTFVYTQDPAATTCGGTFSYLVNGNAANSRTATIAQCDVNVQAANCGLATAPTAKPFVVVSQIASRYASPPPGVLEHVTNPGGLALTAVAGGGVNADGSFVALGSTASAAACPQATSSDAAVAALAGQVPAGASCATVAYTVKDAQNQTSSSTGYVAFLPANGPQVVVKDGPTGIEVKDYRWIIEEDRTFWIDPKCQVNSTDPAVRPASCPPLPVESIGYNFHSAHMPVIATGCVGTVSCEAGQKLQGADAVCDVGNGVCRTDGSAKTPTLPSDVHLDPNKRYFISILPGDAINPTISGFGGTVSDCGTFDPTSDNWKLYNPADGSAGNCGHEMGGSQVAPGARNITVKLQQIPLPTAKISVFVFEDDNPLNGENDAGGGVDVIAPAEAGLGGFEVKLFDQAGQLGDNTGQITYDEFNQPVSNALAGYIDPRTGLDACPITARSDRLVGMIPTCPKYESDGVTPSPLAGQVVIDHLYPGLYEIQAYPAADRIARGEEWLQTNTLDGGKPHEAFIKPNEPGYFQEFGPGGYHVAIGFANPAIINARKDGYCSSTLNTGTNGKNLGCGNTLVVEVTNTHMARTPDQRTFDSGSYDHYAFTQCYVSVGPADGEDFAFQKCELKTESDGSTHAYARFDKMPPGTFKMTVFDQWNDIMLDGLVGTVEIGTGVTNKKFPVTQWRTNLYTRTYVDTDGTGVSTDDKPGLSLVNTNIRYRDGSIGFFNNTDLNGYAGFNEVFPFMNWLVVETTQTRYKPSWTHVVYDAGGPTDCTTDGSILGSEPAPPCTNIAAHIANTDVRVPLPADLRVPGAIYCDNADCLDQTANHGLSTGMLFPPQPFGNSIGWQGLLGQNTFINFGFKPFKPAAGNAPAENGGIHGQVIYASTRPFDDPSLLLQLSWEPGIPHVKVNLYRKTTDGQGNEKLELYDTTETVGWDDWAQGFRTDVDGITPLKAGSGANAGLVPNMNCPGQSADSPFFATLKNSKMWLDPAKNPLAYQSQFKCYDGWSQLNQAQPAPYDGYYRFPSVLAVDPSTGKPAKSNCLHCVANPDDGTPMLPPGDYVVEVVPPAGYELVKEEDKNILMGDVYVAPVTQQFAGFGNVFIMPDQASVNSLYNANSPGGLNTTNTLGSETFPRHEGDTGSIEAYWPCVGALRQVPDFNSEFPGSQQAAPFAGAMRHLCDRKAVTVADESSTLAKFYLFSDTHIAGHFTGTITNDFASEFDPYSPQFGEKFGPPNLPVGLRDFNGTEVARVYSDQWGIYNGLYFSTWSPNPPNPTGYAPQMSIACMNDPGPILDTNPNSATYNQMVTDPAYNPAYSNFCYEQPFMPGETTYMDTPVIPTQSFADGYNLPDTEYPDLTPAIKTVVSNAAPGPYLPATVGVTTVNVVNRGTGYDKSPNVTFSGGGGTGAAAQATMRVTTVNVTNAGSGYTSVPAVTFSGGGGSGVSAVTTLKIVSFAITQAATGTTCTANVSHAVSFSGGGTVAPAIGTAAISGGRLQSINLVFAGIYTGVPTVAVANCPGVTAITAKMGVGAISTAALVGGNPGSGYTSSPTVAIASAPSGGVNATATALLSVDAVQVTAPGSNYTSAPTVTLTRADALGSGATATAVLGASASGTLTITALGDKQVQNPHFSGPNSTTPPYNQKTIARHYNFGDTQGVAELVAPDGTTRVALNVAPGGWTSSTITASVPSLSPAFNCRVQQRGAPIAQCGQLVITRGDNGKRTIDAITVTAGGTAPWIVTEKGVTAPAGKTVRDYGKAFGRLNLVLGATNQDPIQVALDSADPGDLILVQPGTYRENLIMWKPVRLQGVGAGAVTVNADAHPAGHMDQWRRQMVCVFGLTLDGIPNLGNDPAKFDPTGTYSCPTEMWLKGDRIPFEAITGWQAAGNGNLAQVLQEPTLLGAYEGAGITVVGRGIRIPANSTDYWGDDPTAAGAFPDGARYLNNSTGDCTSSPALTDGTDYGTSNYRCNPSSIDGVSILNSSQGGGGVFIHGWAHNLEVANTRVSSNHGTLAGAINLGNGETPPVFTNDGTTCGFGTTALCPPLGNTALGAAIPFGFNTNVRIHHNMLWNNASIGDALFTGTPAGAGGVTVSAGGDNYQIDHNWIAGNLSTGDGGGIQTLGVTFNGKIANNVVMFNQSTNPTLPTNGGGIVIQGANEPRTLNGTECGGSTDTDCPPGLGDGVGNGLVIDGNLIYGNSAESGTGGGLALEMINGSEVVAFPTASNRWYGVSVTNNIIANNVAGYDGGGVSMRDAMKVSFVNNTIASNDTTATAGVLFKTLGAINASSPPPGCNAQTDPTLPQDPSCLGRDAPHGVQPSGLVTMAHTQNLNDAIRALPGTGNKLACPNGFGYANGDCSLLSRPALVNDLFWQNRTFSVDVVGLDVGLKSQQNVIVLSPALVQTTSGQCPAGAQYWDIGLRTDDVQSGILSAALNKLAITNSILTGPGDIGTLQETLASASNRYGTAGGTVVGQICNGARVPPEHCTDAGIDQNSPTCKGFNAPAGASETTSTPTLFVFAGIQPTATVDEGHNWLNLTYGPLTLSRPNPAGGAAAPTAGEQMLASPAIGTTAGAYSVPATSPAVGGGTTAGAPSVDFYGNPRSGRNDIGAVQVGFNQGTAYVAPGSVFFGDVAYGATSGVQTVTLTNGTGAAINGVTFTVSAPFVRNGGTCGTAAFALNSGASCTVGISVTVPTSTSTTATAGTGTLTVNNTSGVTITNSPVALSVNEVPPRNDLKVTIDDGRTTLYRGDRTVYTIVVNNVGNTTVTGAVLANARPAAFSSYSWTCAAVNGATCNGSATGTGSISRNLGALPPGGNVVFTVTAGVANNAAAGAVNNAATLTMPAGVTDANAADNTATDADTVALGTGRAAFTSASPVALNATGTTLNFGAVGPGATSTVTVSVTTAPVTFGQAQLGGSNRYTIGADSCSGQTVPAGQTCSITVNFDGTGTTTRNGTLTLVDDGANGPQALALTGS